MTYEEIAEVAHEVNRAYCEALGDTSQVSWKETPDWQSESIIAGVLFHLGHPEAMPADSHNEWLKKKREDGWTYGDVKDVEKKEHPCFLPYSRLPKEQQAKDYIFSAIVRALS